MPPAAFDGQTFLVVDDEPSIREFVTLTLEASGGHCYAAEDGVKALALFLEGQDHIAVVIADLQMPNMDGITLVRALRGISSTVKIVVSSGHLTPEARAALKELGVSAFLPKPYTANKLLRCVRSTLGRALAPVS